MICFMLTHLALGLLAAKAYLTHTEPRGLVQPQIYSRPTINIFQVVIILAHTDSSNSSVTQSSTVASMLPLQHLRVDDAEQCLSYFYSVVVKSHTLESYNQAINLLLEAGKRRFNADCAFVTRPVSDTVYEVQAFSFSDEERFYVGQHISAADSLCLRARRSDLPVVVENVGDGIASTAYGGVALGSYVGMQVKTQFSPSSVVCFISSSARDVGLDDEDQNLLAQLADGVAYLVDQQKTQAQRKNIDSTMFANGSISTLDEYMEQAKIPELYGIPGRVVDVLKNRIGDSPLSIGHVSEELNLSKRTLQRRLQQQSVNFAELRDQVRYHYSIDYLVKNHKSIDGISVALDFSDRTSFTNAFKRWTGMSPSTFRKLFRDFV